MKLIAWLVRVSESRFNYWMTYLVDLFLMCFFLGWEIEHHAMRGEVIAALFVLGALVWTLSEYAFHRWVYHLGFALARRGHERHHEDPMATIAMPWVVTPLLFVPPQQLVASHFGVPGFSAFLSGWFAGFVAYSFMHHSLHHYKLPFAWYRHLQSQHRIHHALPETNFGVTMRFWDRVFGTEFSKSAT
jgi:sterol desaturase/sphingolipid hydroxylase (fatty acid hydroxylase superfamily)